MQSEQIGKLAEALAAAQGEIAAPKKGRTATIKTDKATYQYAYADLADVIECYRKPLSAHGLALTQAMRVQDGHIILSTKLLHLSDQWIASEYPIQSYNRPQEQGSAITYARRYAVTALLGIAAEDDDDGQAAQDGTAKAQEKAKPAEKPEPKASALSQEERLALTGLAKSRGIFTPQAFAAFLAGHCPEARAAADLSRSEYVAVTEALNGMPEAKKVPA